MSRVEQRINELIKRIDALQASINTLTALVNAKLPNAPRIDPYPQPGWPWPTSPTEPYYQVTSKADSK